MWSTRKVRAPLRVSDHYMSGEYLLEGTAITLVASQRIRSAQANGRWTLHPRDGRTESWLRDHDLYDKLFATRREAARAFEAAAAQQLPPAPAPTITHTPVRLIRVSAAVHRTMGGRVTVTAGDEDGWDINGLGIIYNACSLYRARERITDILTRMGENPHEW